MFSILVFILFNLNIFTTKTEDQSSTLSHNNCHNQIFSSKNHPFEQQMASLLHTHFDFLPLLDRPHFLWTSAGHTKKEVKADRVRQPFTQETLYW